MTGVLCHYILSISWIESFLIGALLSSTDAASVFSILRSKQLNLKYNTASLLELESGSNDPVAYMMTAILITVAKGSLNSYQLIQMLVLQIGGGIVCGILFAAVSVYLMKHYRFSTDGFDIIFSVGIALLAYAMPTAMGANGYLSVYIVGIVLGNSDIKNKTNLVHFFDGMTGLTQILIFFFAGTFGVSIKTATSGFAGSCDCIDRDVYCAAVVGVSGFDAISSQSSTADPCLLVRAAWSRIHRVCYDGDAEFEIGK